MASLLKYLAVPVLALLCASSGAAVGELLGRHVPPQGPMLHLAIGLGAGVVAYPILFRGEFFRTFEHELTHMFVALLFFKRPRSFKATDRGDGEHVHVGGNNFVISLSPYFVFTLTVPLMALSPVVAAPYGAYLTGLIGASAAYHLLSTAQEFRPYQPDVRRHGLVFSAAVVILGNLLFVLLVLSLTAGGLDLAASRFREAGYELPRRWILAAWSRLPPLHGITWN